MIVHRACEDPDPKKIIITNKKPLKKEKVRVTKLPSTDNNGKNKWITHNPGQ